jgi:hypothetical protein
MTNQCEKCHDDILPVNEDDTRYLHDLGLPVLCRDCNNRRLEDNQWTI